MTAHRDGDVRGLLYQVEESGEVNGDGSNDAGCGGQAGGDGGSEGGGGTCGAGTGGTGRSSGVAVCNQTGREEPLASWAAGSGPPGFWW